MDRRRTRESTPRSERHYDAQGDLQAMVVAAIAYVIVAIAVIVLWIVLQRFLGGKT
jgi:uncharacterized membrane protein